MSVATPDANSEVFVPGCRLHSSRPPPSNLITQASGRLIRLEPISPTLPSLSAATPCASSSSLVPSCRLHSRGPSPSNLITHASGRPLLAPPSAPPVPPATKTLPSMSAATPCAESGTLVPSCRVHNWLPLLSNLIAQASPFPLLGPPSAPSV